jgi:hypothetical protein
LSFDNGTHGTYDVDFADVLGAGVGATVAMNYSTGAGNGAVIQWADTSGVSSAAPKMILMGFPFESIYTGSQRNALMGAVLTYFGTNGTILTTTPAGVDMLATSDSGQSNIDNRTNRNGSASAPLEFQVAGTISGSTVRLYFGNTLIGSKTATGATTDFLISGTTLSGTQTLASTQQESGKAESLKTTGFSLTIDTAAPPVPAAPTIAATSTSSISLNWADVAGTDVWGYNIYRATASGGPYTKLNGATPFAASDYVDNTVTDGQTYYYVTRSVDTAGNESADSGQSNAAVALDPSAQPATPDLVAAYDAGASDSDDITNLNNSTPAKVLVFSVDDTVPGATLDLYAGATIIATVTVTDTTTLVTTDGNTLLTQGFNNISARQSEPGKNPTMSLGLGITVDVVPPAAALGSQTPTRAAATFDFTVTYTDSGGSLIDPATLGDDDVTVVGPDNTVYAATLVSAGVGGSPRVVTYRISAPGGTWESADAGSYSVVQSAGGVADVAGNFRPAGAVGSFNANLPYAYLVGNTLHAEHLAAGSHVWLQSTGFNLNVKQGAATLVFEFADFTSIVVHGTAGGDTLDFTGPIAQPVTYNGGSGDDAVVVWGGTYTFDGDASATTANLAVDVKAGAEIIFNATQHLRDLNVAGTATLTQGNGKVIVTRGLSVAGQLDLTDNDLVLDFDNSSDDPFATVEGRIAAAYDFGAWDLDGIRTSMPDAATGLTTLGVGDAAALFGLGASDTVEFSGVTVDGTSVLIKYTYAGDANLDGVIDGGDYGIIDNFVQVPGASGYFNGDFNFDGVVDGGDYGIIDNNIQAQGAPL